MFEKFGQNRVKYDPLSENATWSKLTNQVHVTIARTFFDNTGILKGFEQGEVNIGILNCTMHFMCVLSVFVSNEKTPWDTQK